MSIRDQLTEEINNSQKNRPRPPVGPNDSKPLKGIGGWLLFFCASVTILSPGLLAYSLILRYERGNIAASSLIPLFVEGALTAYGMVIGIRLWSLQSNSLRQTRVFLFVSQAVLVAQAAYGALIGGDLILSIGGFLLEAAYIFLWMLYFKNSRRIANTFGSRVIPEKSADAPLQ